MSNLKGTNIFTFSSFIVFKLFFFLLSLFLVFFKENFSCAAILKGSDFSVLDQAECQFTTTATVLENGSQVFLVLEVDLILTYLSLKILIFEFLIISCEVGFVGSSVSTCVMRFIFCFWKNKLIICVIRF